MATPGPLRVTLVTPYFPAHRGGVEIVAGELAARLARAGVDIAWHASDTDPPPTGLRCAPAGACNLAERRLGFPYPLWSPRAMVALARAIARSDAVHLHDSVYLPNVFAFLVAAIRRRPVLVTQHVGPIPYRSALLRFLLGAANRTLARLVLGRAKQAVFISDAVLRYFEGFVRFRKPPLFIPNGVDTRLFQPAEAAQRERLRAELGTPLLLFVGRFVEKKGLALLHELARALPEARFVFAGWGPLDPQAWGLANVRVEHSPPRERLVSLYQAADLLVLPSVGEGFPLVVQEAMACGTPALVSEQTAAGAPEARHLLHTEALDATRWAARIRQLLGTPAARRAEVASFAQSHWSWDECAARYLALLRTVSAR